MALGDYVPKCGDAVWINLNPQAGHEQAGRRPAVVLSPLEYNDKVGLALFCPVTNQQKGYPFEVPISPNEYVGGVILADQIKSLDWRTRNVEFICTLPENVVAEVMAKIATLLSSSI